MADLPEGIGGPVGKHDAVAQKVAFIAASAFGLEAMLFVLLGLQVPVLPEVGPASLESVIVGTAALAARKTSRRCRACSNSRSCSTIFRSRICGKYVSAPLMTSAMTRPPFCSASTRVISLSLVASI